MSEASARATLRERASACEVRIPGVCIGRPLNAHHRKNRSQGGTWDVSNLLAACGSGTTGCHGWITEHPEKACELGWAVRSTDDPATVPALIWTPNGYGWWLPDDEGLFTWQDRAIPELTV